MISQIRAPITTINLNVTLQLHRAHREVLLREQVSACQLLRFLTVAWVISLLVELLLYSLYHDQ